MKETFNAHQKSFSHFSEFSSFVFTCNASRRSGASPPLHELTLFFRHKFFSLGFFSFSFFFCSNCIARRNSFFLSEIRWKIYVTLRHLNERSRQRERIEQNEMQVNAIERHFVNNLSIFDSHEVENAFIFFLSFVIRCYIFVVSNF